MLELNKCAMDKKKSPEKNVTRTSNIIGLFLSGLIALGFMIWAIFTKDQTQIPKPQNLFIAVMLGLFIASISLALYLAKRRKDNT